MKDNWIVEKESHNLREKISKNLDISPITAQVLINRGIKNDAEAQSFINPSLFDLPSPFLMKDMDKAVSRLMEAITCGEKIAIYGDYDVDGVTATSLFYNFLNSIGGNVCYYNPDRLKEGYGINFDAVRKLKKDGVSLIVSGDCGITAWKEVEQGKDISIDFIITDHHKPPNKLPDSVAILNPHQPDCKYPAKEITGVGVIYNLVIALRRTLRDENFFNTIEEPNLGNYLDLVALGTVADCAPLVNMNRVLVKEGLKRISKSKRHGVIALKEVSSLKNDVSAFDLGFKLGPRINAVGRLSNADTAVELLTTEDINKARTFAGLMNDENINRQKLEAYILEEAIGMVEDNKTYLDSSSLVLASRDWHSGVIGIVASRLCERYNKPVFLIAVDENNIGKGSGRGVEGINLYLILSELKENFEQFGGHELAAGITIKNENIDMFRNMFSESVKKNRNNKASVLKIDCRLSFAEINENLLNELSILEPFGIGNPAPVFLTEAVDVVSQRVFKEKHIGLTLQKGNIKFEAMWFNLKNIISMSDVVDIVFTPEFNNWNGKKSIRLNIKDVCLH